MKLRKNRAAYRIPEHSQIQLVRIEGNQRRNQMCSILLPQMDMQELSALRQFNGTPAAFAVFNTTIRFYPTPDGPYAVKVRYVPPIKEY